MLYSTYKESFRFSMPLWDISVDTNQAFIVRANETLHNRIIISTLQIVEAYIGIVVIASISAGVSLTNTAGSGYFAPSIVGIVCDHAAGGIDNAHNVAQQVLHIIVLSTIIDERVGTAAFVVKEIHIIGSPSLTNEQTVGVIVIVNGIANSFLCSQTICTVLQKQNFRVASTA